ncbi:YfjI family protein [bacterium]|nr:YfjI family protein [bacterium]
MSPQTHGPIDDSQKAKARAAVLSKLRGYAVRLALIFELCKSAEDGTAELAESVGVESMAAGIAVVDWFAAEAVKLYREFSAATPDAEQRLDDRILTLLRERGRVSEGAIRDALSRNPSSDDVRSSLRRLEVAGHAQFAGSERTGGRPRRMWELAQ